MVKTLPSLDTTDIPSDPNAIRTVIISGLPAGIEKNVLWKKVRKTGDCELVFPIDGAPDTGMSACMGGIDSSALHLPLSR